VLFRLPMTSDQIQQSLICSVYVLYYELLRIRELLFIVKKFFLFH
jgi:hypothetical protein